MLKDASPKWGTQVLGLPWTLEFFQEWMERAHSQRGREKETERRKDVKVST